MDKENNRSTAIYCRSRDYISVYLKIHYQMDSLVWTVKKDVASCDKLGGAACGLWTQDLRIGNFLARECREANLRRELKHLSTGRKRKHNVIPWLAASEKGTGQTESSFEREIEMWWRSVAKSMRRSSLEWDASEGDSPVFEIDMPLFDRVGLPELEVRIWQD